MDTWDAGELYEQYMGRWSRRISGDFLRWLDAGVGRRWLDVGCGTGALTAEVVRTARPTAAVGVDASAAFVDSARRTVEGATFDVGDAARLAYGDRAFDVCVSALALNFVPDPAGAIGHMRRVTADGGVVGAYVWDYARGMQMLRFFWDAAVDVDPAAETLDEARRFPLCEEGALADAFRAAGIDAVERRALTTATVFTSFDQLWQPFLSGQGPAPSYVAGLAPLHREALASRLRERLPIGPDGAIALTATAWAVKGRA